ncbi:MAG: B12-binding domain-containing radical SAM protein, partial [Verrucomicrobiota bacterium]
MPDIVLSTLNAKYLHASFGLRCLLANLGDLSDRAAILEFDINQRPLDIAEALLAAAPRILGLGVYVWNAAPTLELVGILRRLRPDLVLVLGGPEVSHEWDRQPIIALADHVITGEADLAFAALCRDLLSGSAPRPPRLIAAPVPDVAALADPYGLYDDRDLDHRVVYVEASRGCPFTCEFCLSALDDGVRLFPLDAFLQDLQQLSDRGCRAFKFI